jgi:hypothetical protein
VQSNTKPIENIKQLAKQCASSVLYEERNENQAM